MQGVLFASILHMSLIGCYCIVVVLFARLLLMQCGRRYAYCLWLAVFVNLCLPVTLTITGFFSLIPRQITELSLNDELSLEIVTPTVDALEQEVQMHVLSVNEATKTDEMQGITDAEPTSENPNISTDREHIETKASGWKDQFTDVKLRTKVLSLAEIIWLMGILGFFVYNFFVVIRFVLKLSKVPLVKWKKQERIAEVKGISSPFLWGLFRPVIYLPAGMDSEEKQYIIAHEKCHRKRKDHLIKIFIYGVTILHWFNPLVWLAYSLCCKDMEISCDEAVLSHSRKNICKAYASSLLKYAAKQNGYTITPLTFGEPSIKSRIQNVLHFKKKSVAISILAGLCVIGVAAGLLFRPVGNVKEPKLDENGAVEQKEAIEDTTEENTLNGADGQQAIVNNGGRIIGIQGEFYYIDGLNLYSDGQKLYASILDDEGLWKVRSYELDGSGFENVFNGRIVDISGDEKVLYVMFELGDIGLEALGWYNIQTKESGSFYRGPVSYLGKYNGYLYVSRQEEDGLYIDRIREGDLVSETDLLVLEESSSTLISSFYADEDYLLFAAGETQGSMGLFYGEFYSYELATGELRKEHLTDHNAFMASNGYIYYQKYFNQQDSNELFRASYDLSEEQQVGEGLTFLAFDKSDGTILAGKQLEQADLKGIHNLVRIHLDGSEEELLLDMAHMLELSYDTSKSIEELVKLEKVWEKVDFSLAWELEEGDKICFSELDLLGDVLFVKAEQIGYREEANYGWRDSIIQEIYLKIDADGMVSFWNPETLTPGWEDTSYLTNPMPGVPCDPKESDWDLENVTDVRDIFTSMPYTPKLGTENDTYLLGITENYTLYGKGDYASMLLERNGRYSEIRYPYISNYGLLPDLMEADFDRDGIEELAIKFNIKHGTGLSVDTFLMADFAGDGKLYVSQFLEEDFIAQLSEHLTYERTENGLQALVNQQPVGAVMEDDEIGSYESVSVGNLVKFRYGDCKVIIQADLEFWMDSASQATPVYNEWGIQAIVKYEDDGQFTLQTFEGRNVSLESAVISALEAEYMEMDQDEKDTYIWIDEIRYDMENLKQDTVEVEVVVYPIGSESYDYATVRVGKTPNNSFGWKVENILLEK